MLDHQAAVLHHQDAGARERFGDDVAADPALQPHTSRPRREQVVEVRCDICRAPEHIDDVEHRRHVGDARVRRLTEDGAHVRVVDRHWEDLHTRVVQIFAHGERRSVGEGLGAHAEHGDALSRSGDEPNALRVFYDAVSKVVHGQRCGRRNARTIAEPAACARRRAPHPLAMSDAMLDALRQRLAERLPGLTRSGMGLRSALDARYGMLVLRLDWDAEAESIRVAAHIPPPAGSGTELLVWCLATNAQYWDVKIGLDDEGLLVVHADVDADPEGDLGALAERLSDRAETIRELLDDDLAPYLLDRGLGTPAQRARWIDRAETDDDDDDADG